MFLGDPTCMSHEFMRIDNLLESRVMRHKARGVSSREAL